MWQILCASAGGIWAAVLSGVSAIAGGLRKQEGMQEGGPGLFTYG